MGDHTLAVEIPADDGAIQQALAELDAQLEAWKAAMHRAQRALVERPARVAALTPEAPAAVQPASVRSADTTSIASQDAAAEIDIAAHETSAAVAGRPESVGGERETQAPASVAEEVAASEDVAGPFTAIRTEAAPAAVSSQAEDDEALLASLDEGTAKAIRVMRRLSTTRRGVRELLAEYETSKSHQAKDQPTKRSWWKRGK